MSRPNHTGIRLLHLFAVCRRRDHLSRRHMLDGGQGLISRVSQHLRLDVMSHRGCLYWLRGRKLGLHLLDNLNFGGVGWGGHLDRFCDDGCLEDSVGRRLVVGVLDSHFRDRLGGSGRALVNRRLGRRSCGCGPHHHHLSRRDIPAVVVRGWRRQSLSFDDRALYDLLGPSLRR